MRKTAMIVGSALALALAPVPPAAGQVSISPYAGAMIYDGSMMIAEGGAIQGSGFENDPPVGVLGLRAGYAFANGAELEVAYGRSWLRNDTEDIASHLYQAMVRYRVLASGAWSAYLAAGGGGITYRSESGRLGSLSDPAVAGGVGMSYGLSPALDLRSDLTFMGQFCDEPEESDGLVCNDGSRLGYTQLSAGVRVRLGTRR